MAKELSPLCDMNLRLTGEQSICKVPSSRAATAHNMARRARQIQEYDRCAPQDINPNILHQYRHIYVAFHSKLMHWVRGSRPHILTPHAASTPNPVECCLCKATLLLNTGPESSPHHKLE